MRRMTSRPGSLLALVLVASTGLSLGACKGSSSAGARPQTTYAPRATYSQPTPYVATPPAYSSPTPAPAPGPAPAYAPTPSGTASHGAFAWYPSLAQAAAEARATGRLVFLESGKPDCGNCQVLKNQIIAGEAVGSDLASMSVGYYDDIAREPYSQAFNLLQKNLPYAVMLPLVGWVTPDLQWVHGFSGGHDAAQFRNEIATARAMSRRFASAGGPSSGTTNAEPPPLANAPRPTFPDPELADVGGDVLGQGEVDLATPAVAKALAGPDSPPPAAPAPAPTPVAPTTSSPPATAGTGPEPIVPILPPSPPPGEMPMPPTGGPPPTPDPAPVVAPPSASTTVPDPTTPATGTAPAATDDGAAWAQKALAEAAAALKDGDVSKTRAILAEVKARRHGLPEEREADKGEVAIYNLGLIRRASGPEEAARLKAKAAADLKNTVWAGLF
jgi:hypothetical protein